MKKPSQMKRKMLSSSLSAWQAMLTLTLCLVLDIYGCFAEDPATFTPSDLKSFQDPSSGYYRHLVIDSQASALYVGAMEYVFRLDATNIQQQYAKSQKLIPVSGEEVACARKGKNREFDCKNHIRSIIVHPDKVSVCGTGAYQPRTFSLQKEHLEILQAGPRGSGIAQCPFDPNDNSTYIYIQNGNPDDIPAVYSATVTDFAKSDPMIFRPKLRKDGMQYDLLRTLPQDRKWLNEANFVGSFDMDEYVYFFFRETAVEYMNCGKAVYARVARVCKIDKGGRSVLEKKWTTYVKARLNCSLPGDYPFYFNELHDVYKKDGLFYGVFTTPQSGLFGSAVCAFNRGQIDAVFEGNFKEQIDTNYNWLKVPQAEVPTPRPASCAKDTRNQPDNVLQFIKTHPLMDTAVRQKKGRPMFHQGNIIFRNIAIDVVREYKVFFLGTNRGEIHKVLHWADAVTGDYYSHTLAIWKPFGNTVNPIWQMKLYRKHLYLGTDEKVVQFPVQQCEAYTMCSNCIRDPYCGWDYHQNRCSNNKTGLYQGVQETEPAKLCASCCKVESYRTSVRLQGDSVFLNCSSTCSAADSVQWYRGSTRLTIDYNKYFLVANQGLVIMNVTSVDGATYRCKSDTVLRTEHILHVTPCSDPACYFNEEFRNWCSAFEQYKQDYNHWRCLKDSCIRDEHCVPSNVATTCKRP